MRFFVAVFAVCAVVPLASCDTVGCPDCGPCGFQGGPNVGIGLSAAPGLDGRQALQVALHAGGPNECGGPHLSWMDEGGGVTFKPDFEGLNHAELQQLPRNGTGAVYAWEGRTVRIVRVDAASVRITLEAPGRATLTRTCATSDGKTVTCT